MACCIFILNQIGLNLVHKVNDLICKKYLSSKMVLWISYIVQQNKFQNQDIILILQILLNEIYSALLSWLEDLDKHGFVLVKNVPIKQGPVHELQV